VDDLVQDTWLEVIATSHWPTRAFLPWVQAIAMGYALDRSAQHELHAGAEAVDARWPDPFAAISDIPDVLGSSYIVTARALTRPVLSALATLPGEQRAAWTLRYLDRELFEEIARQQTVPMHAAKTRVRLADEGLVAILETRGIDAARPRPSDRATVTPTPVPGSEPAAAPPVLGHDRADDLALDLTEGTLTPALREAVVAHATACAICHQTIDRLASAKRISALVARDLVSKRADVEAPPATVDVQVLTASHAAAARRATRRRSQGRRMIAIAAVGVVAVVAGVLAALW
jgi:DNA-directed RNA polymerase specialized sigma24 family protein